MDEAKLRAMAEQAGYVVVKNDPETGSSVDVDLEEVMTEVFDDLRVLQRVREATASIIGSTRDPEAAAAMIEAWNQYAIPAQEETKRAIEETTRFRYRAVAYPIVLAIGIIAMTIQPISAEWIALALVGVLGSVEGVQLVDRILTKRSKASRALGKRSPTDLDRDG